MFREDGKTERQTERRSWFNRLHREFYLTALGTTLPTIANTLDDTKGDYIWVSYYFQVGSAYALSSTDFIPAFAKPITLVSIAFFVIDSALAGASQNMAMLIAARSIGRGGILTLTEIITADLVPLAERGLYQVQELGLPEPLTLPG
ncbi:hypothetical protein C8R44DRAFT_753720 [Mycena epipterygia]|nr:hypothetical protein C8R44DRAFT_753720 [Mycena epipterygia]